VVIADLFTLIILITIFKFGWLHLQILHLYRAYSICTICTSKLQFFAFSKKDKHSYPYY